MRTRGDSCDGSVGLSLDKGEGGERSGAADEGGEGQPIGQPMGPPMGQQGQQAQGQAAEPTQQAQGGGATPPVNNMFMRSGGLSSDNLNKT
jgi:hypothetical protein